MTQWFHNAHAQTMTKLTDLVRRSCWVKLDIGEKPGVIEGIADVVDADDTQQAINLSKFTVRLESGVVVIVPGSELSRIDAEVVTS